MNRAIIIGTGFSGIGMGIKLKEAGIHDFIILEKAGEIGGTWRENTYPGAECDIPSALYSFSFEPYTRWENKWSHQPQILDYLKHCTKKYGLYPYIHFHKEMIGAEFQEKEGFWRVKTKDGAIYEAQSLITAIGQLHYPRRANIKGQEIFEGESWHSAEWNHEVKLEGKNVGVIGNAASAVQFVPQIAPLAKKLSVFQRSANWMIPKQDRPYYEWEKNLAKQFPVLLKIYRQRIWLTGGLMFFLMKKDKFPKKLGEAYSKMFINQTIEDPELRQKLIPDYPIGAKRVLFSDDYYPALNRKNVELITDNISEIKSNSVITKEGKEIPLDVIIYSTGFQTNPFLMGLDIKGLGGKSIQKAWEKGAEAYLGITTLDFPNLFMMYGPNTNLGHNSIIIMSECQADYISQCVQTLKKHDFKYMKVKPEVNEAYNQEMQARLQDSVWDLISDSWYKTDGKVTNNWPGRTMEYSQRTRKVNYAAFQFIQ